MEAGTAFRRNTSTRRLEIASVEQNPPPIIDNSASYAGGRFAVPRDVRHSVGPHGSR